MVRVVYSRHAAVVVAQPVTDDQVAPEVAEREVQRFGNQLRMATSSFSLFIVFFGNYLLSRVRKIRTFC